MTQLPNLAFSFPFRGVIWKTAFDSAKGCLALEIRDTENFKIVYHILDLKKQTMLEEIKFEEADWWSSLLQFQGGYLFIEKYKDTQRPLQKDLLVYDTREKSLKVYVGYQLSGLENGVLRIQNNEDPSAIVEEKIRNEGIPAENSLIHPAFFDLSSPEFEVVRQYLATGELALGCEYLEWKDYIIISYYLRSGKEFVRKLLVIREEKEWVHETHDEKVQGFAPGSFFVFEKYLVFIVGKNRIDAIEL